MMLTALLIHGAQTGPLLMTANPEIFWGVISSMYVGNVTLVLLNLPFIGAFVALLRLPRYFIATTIALLCLIGTYAVANSLLDLWVLMISGVAGYLLRKLGFEPALLILALALGPILEQSLIQSLFLVQGDWIEILRRPISGSLFAIGALILLAPLLLRRFNRAAIAESEVQP